jgi:hypothetical protein
MRALAGSRDFEVTLASALTNEGENEMAFGNCGQEFKNRKLKPGEDQRFNMLGGLLCQPCWDVTAVERRREGEASE